MSILESLKYNPLDALKYGPIALAALTALWVATLLTIELKRPQVRKGAQKILSEFMIFCLVLTAASWGLYSFDEHGKQQIVHDRDARIAELERQVATIERERDDRLANIRELIVRIDSEAINKLRAENNPGPVDKDTLGHIATSLCSAVTDVYHTAGGIAPTHTCAAEQVGHQ
jgi:hypothetical protein